MAYTAPTTRVTGELIEAADWNTDLTDNIAYLYARIALIATAGFPRSFPGSFDQSLNVDTTYVAGATFAARAPGTGLLVFDPAIFSGMTVRWEATLRAESGATATVALFDSAAPNTALTGSEISSTSTDGARVQSGDITLPAGGAPLTFFIKGHGGHASLQGWGLGYAIYPAN